MKSHVDWIIKGLFDNEVHKTLLLRAEVHWLMHGCVLAYFMQPLEKKSRVFNCSNN